MKSMASKQGHVQWFISDLVSVVNVESIECRITP